jgi:hypothetical protein
LRGFSQKADFVQLIHAALLQAGNTDKGAGIGAISGWLLKLVRAIHGAWRAGLNSAQIVQLQVVVD